MTVGLVDAAVPDVSLFLIFADVAAAFKKQRPCCLMIEKRATYNKLIGATRREKTVRIIKLRHGCDMTHSVNTENLNLSIIQIYLNTYA